MTTRNGKEKERKGKQSKMIQQNQINNGKSEVKGISRKKKSKQSISIEFTRRRDKEEKNFNQDIRRSCEGSDGGSYSSHTSHGYW